jgi:CheY-like chemotaxis protein
VRILIADDDKAMVKLLAACVEYCGHSPLTASDGEEAVAVFHEHKPDIVLMDIIMPTVDGLTAAQRILQSDSQARIVFITGIGDYPENIPPEIRRRVSILTKPVTLHAILSLIEQHAAPNPQAVTS